MSRRTLLYLSAILVVFGSAFMAHAGVPELMNYQGTLLDSGGDPVTTTVTVTFSIYDHESVGNLLWAESQQVTPDAEGRFGVTLGEGTSLPPNVQLDEAVFSAKERWLETAVESDPPMTPRVQIVTVGYAFRVGTIDGSKGGTVFDDLTIQNELFVTGRATIGDGHTNTGLYTFVAGRNNTTTGPYSTVGGGYQNVANGDSSTIAGGTDNTASGPSSTVGGGSHNTAMTGYTTVCGGYDNTTLYFGFIGGGEHNTAYGHSAIGGGGYNHARGQYSVICGGGGWDEVDSNSIPISGAYSAILGGQSNVASNLHSTVCGGRSNTADGVYSFAAGRNAKALNAGSFVWADQSAFDFPSTYSNEFSARCRGGVRFVTGIDESGNPNAGVQVAPGGGSWSSISDRNLKENFSPVDAAAFLEKLAAIPINTWNYKAQDKSIRHIGPMAQDVYAAFGVGESDRHITTVDADGIALAAIKALHAKNQELEKQLAELQAQMQQLLAEQQ